MKSIIYIILLSVCFLAKGQKFDYIIGKVVDQQKMPLPGITIQIFHKDKAISGMISDTCGFYKSAVPDSIKDFTIVFSFIGMKQKKIYVNRKEKSK